MKNNEKPSKTKENEKKNEVANEKKMKLQMKKKWSLMAKGDEQKWKKWRLNEKKTIMKMIMKMKMEMKMKMKKMKQ